ncbi:MAG TPA: hypothetical protein VG756_26970 [Pseudonocardiaceae bacterium]|jgi:hypothetical protein|nr:hypothetical protein [Pseudonocardiaceae bacterium]
MPGTVIPRVRASAATTPGRLTLIMAGLSLLAVLTGVVGLTTLQGKASTLDDLVNQREPVNAAAQQIYRALSDADATAASAFLSGAIEPAALRDRYSTDVQQAGIALAVAATDISSGNSEAGLPIAQLSADLPAYTGLIERATANNEQGYPVGSAYLREADNLMRTVLLPAAQKLYDIDTARMSGEQDDAAAFPWVLTVLVVALIAGLVLAQRYLSGRTNRTFNLGLVVASGAALIAVLWTAVGLTMSTIYVNKGEDTGSGVVTVLTNVRSAALQARTDEMLTLVDRGGVDYSTQFDGLANRIGGKDGSGGLLQIAELASDSSTVQPIHTAMTSAQQWFALHDRMTKADNDGDYAAAVQIALGTDPQYKESNAFYQLDDAVAKAVLQGRTNFLDQTATASNWLTILPIGVLVLGLLAAAGCVLGIWQRLREYR